MGVTRRAPVWLGWVLAGGLALVFLGARILQGTPGPRLVVTGAATLLVLAVAAWRVVSWRAARRAGTREEARVEAQLALAHAGCVLALLLYFLSSDAGIALLRLDFGDAAARGRYRTALQVLCAAVAAISLLPAVVAAFAPGVRRGPGGGGLLETARISDSFNAGLVIALAGTLLFLLGFVAAREDRTLDAGYFRTSRPGTATTALARSLKGPLHVVLFFPDASPVKGEVEDYFRALGRTGVRVRLESHDPMVNPDAARRYEVRVDGAIVLEANGARAGQAMPVEMQYARPRLRVLDRDIQYRLTQLVRGERVAYVTVGHGELNDTAATAATDDRLGGVAALRRLLAALNYEVQDLGLRSGSGREVPGDAALVLVLGPRRSFLPEELAALDRYVARGGSLLLALEARSGFRLGPLEQRLGLRFDGLPLADDQQYMRRKDDVSDRGLVIGVVSGYHPAVSAAAAAGGADVGLFPDPARLEAVEGSATHPVFVMQTPPTAFLDRNGNYEEDGPQEARGVYYLGAAVQADSARVLVYTSAEMFADATLPNLRVNASLAADGLRWLGREEAFAGSTGSEEDVPIQHTRAQDVAWFYTTILGAPALVLTVGLLGVRRRRRTGRPA